jgi:methylmalonyl-CoA mutase
MVAPDPTHPDLARWRELARGAAKGREPDQLARRLAGDLTVAPLYVDRPAVSPAVGRDGPWQARVPVDGGGQAIAEIVRRGAVPEIAVGPARTGCGALCGFAEVAPGTPLVVDAGAGVALVMAAVGPGAIVTILADPIGAFAAFGGLAIPLHAAFDALAGALLAPGAPPPGPASPRVVVAASGVWAAEAGAEAPTQIAVALASAVATLRALRERGVSTATAAAGLELRIALRGDVLVDLAAVRASRGLLARLLIASGVDPAVATVAAALPTTELSSVDPPTNLLRMAAAGFAGAAGGADALALPPHDAATGAPSLAGVKLAANLHLLLSAEAMLARVQDPTAGSYAVEHLTDALARAAWAELQRIEGEGGLIASLRAGAIQARIAVAAADRAARIARREDPILGVSLYADGGDLPLPPRAAPLVAVGHDPVVGCPPIRPADGWESLRRRLAVAPVRAALLPLGPIGHHQARLDFARDLLRAAGFEVILVAPTADPLAAAAAFAVAGADLACLCGRDSDYERAVPEIAAPLRAAGARAVVVAGRWPDPAGPWRDAGVTHVVHLGADVLATCASLADLAAPEPR